MSKDEYSGIGGDDLRDYGGWLERRDRFFLQLGKAIEHPLRLLDAGAGSADLSIAIAKDNPHPFFICTDYERQNLDIARKAASLAGVVDRFRFIHCSATAIPLEPRSIDVAFACSVFSYCQDPITGIRRFYELVKHGGTVAFNVATQAYDPGPTYAHIKWAHDFHYFTSTELEQIASLPGLQERLVEPSVEIFRFEVPRER